MSSNEPSSQKAESRRLSAVSHHYDPQLANEDDAAVLGKIDICFAHETFESCCFVMLIQRVVIQRSSAINKSYAVTSPCLRSLV